MNDFLKSITEHASAAISKNNGAQPVWWSRSGAALCAGDGKTTWTLTLDGQVVWNERVPSCRARGHYEQWTFRADASDHNYNCAPRLRDGAGQRADCSEPGDGGQR